MKTQISKVIWTSKKAYFFLDEMDRKSKGLNPLSDDGKERLWKRLKNGQRVKNGQVSIDNNSFSFGNGTYNSSWRIATVDEIVTILESNGFKYRNGKPIEYLEVLI
jgi:hypothetical protein